MLEASRVNTAMSKVISSLSWKDVPPLTDEDLLATLAGGFVEVDSCVVLKGEIPHLSQSKGDVLQHRSSHLDLDRTHYECFVNHVHLEPERDARTSILACLAYAGRLAQLLESSPFTGPFLIIVSSSLESFEPAVRFHKIRGREMPWLTQDLEVYSGSAILAITSSALAQELSASVGFC